MSLIIQRQEKTTDSIIGKLTVMGWDKFLYTLENLALHIPAGVYKCVPHDGPHWQGVWEITGVPGRSAILIHAGNTDVDTRGCILVGMARTADAIQMSRDALNLLRQTVGEATSFTLTVLDIPA